MIYKWCKHEKVASFIGKTEKDDSKITWFDKVIGEPLPDINDWVIPTLVQYKGDTPKSKSKKDKPIGSSPFAMVPIIHQKVIDDLGDILEGCRFYPVNLEPSSEPYFILVVDNVIDCLDREKSKGKLRTFGKRKGYFSTIEEWIFFENELNGKDIFRLPDSDIAYYVTDKFVQRVQEFMLPGFCFSKDYWDESPITTEV